MDVEQAAKRVKSFAENSCQGQSQLYEHLCLNFADDVRLIEIARATPRFARCGSKRDALDRLNWWESSQ